LSSKTDDLSSSSDGKLIELAKRELASLGLAREDEVEDGAVVRMQKAYPMYDEGCAEHLEDVRNYLAENLVNLQLVGRNGMHKYNNQDHSMITAICAAENICGPSTPSLIITRSSGQNRPPFLGVPPMRSRPRIEQPISTAGSVAAVSPGLMASRVRTKSAATG